LKRNHSIKLKIVCLLLTFMFLMNGCGKEKAVEKSYVCHVAIEDGTGFSIEHATGKVKAGKDVTFLVKVKAGYHLESTDYPKYAITYGKAADTMKLTLYNVRYSTVVSLTTQKSNQSIFYDANGGKRVDSGSNEKLEETIIPTHVRVNTLIGTDLLERDGYSLIGWNTKADGTGTAVGLGSRVDFINHMTLYAQWSRWTDASSFSYQVKNEQIVITGYKGEDQVLSIPSKIDQKPVVAIAAGAFTNVNCTTVILPLSLKNIESEAFKNVTAKELYLYDSISYMSDYSFDSCNHLETLHLNAVEKPVYSGTYFDTFQDKYDRLTSLNNTKKIVLFSGSSTRFGYDSEKLKEAFPSYEIVNMGVFAYTNATPQMLLLLQQMQKDDILLDSPEFDAAKRQFCTSYDLDESFYAMMESDYDTIGKLDLRMFHNVFSSLNTYLQNRQGMTKKSYDMSADNYDEDENPSSTKTYNKYGDYILYRPNAKVETPVYGLKVEYKMQAFPKAYYIDPLNAMYQQFLDKGIHVYFTYAPRNKYAISEDSTLDARAQLDQYLRNELVVPVISNIEESLVSGICLYKTDNHLSTQGVSMRTDRVIEELGTQMAREGISR